MDDSPTCLAVRPADVSRPGRRPAADESSLLAALLREQQEPSAVERFASWHASGADAARTARYERLLPASPPGPGQQYAFEVDLDRCSGCKACVTACHSLNGLDELETWRDVGLLVGGTAANPLMQHVTTACHHCLEPACLQACPVDAYEKDAVTGIVRHLDDQCFGCQYCILACPYDVPKYHAAKGIVRKCDMCSSRLAVGEAPACVQACPHAAIAIRTVAIQQVLDDCEVGQFLPGAPDPHLTLPTTSYRTQRVLPRNTVPADFHQTAAQHPHGPLIVMLVLTQLSVGAFAAEWGTAKVFGASLLVSIAPRHAVLALMLGLVALAASLIHLGRPRYAYRALIGLRHSWLSREILAFSLFAALAMCDAAAHWMVPFGARAMAGLRLSVVVTGLAAVFCSVMIYVSTRREFWSFGATATRFFLTTGLLGAAMLWLAINCLGDVAAGREAGFAEINRGLSGAVIFVAVAKLLLELLQFRCLASPHLSSGKRAAALQVGPLARLTWARFAAGFAGGVALPLLARSATNTSTARALVAGSVLALVVGELLERRLFFAAAVGPRMPGALRT